MTLPECIHLAGLGLADLLPALGIGDLSLPRGKGLLLLLLESLDTAFLRNGLRLLLLLRFGLLLLLGDRE